MNFAEFTTALSKKLELPKEEVTRRMDATIEVIIEELTRNNSISISGLGILEMKKKNERITVHPSTKAKLLVPPKLVVSFKPSSTLKDKVKNIPL